MIANVAKNVVVMDVIKIVNVNAVKNAVKNLLMDVVKSLIILNFSMIWKFFLLHLSCFLTSIFTIYYIFFAFLVFLLPPSFPSRGGTVLSLTALLYFIVLRVDS